MKKLILFTLLISPLGLAFQTQPPFDQKLVEGSFILHYKKGDEFYKPVSQYCKRAMRVIPEFLKRDFSEKVNVYLFPSRDDLDRQWQTAWGMPGFESQCWMVGSGILHRLDLLSPSVWPDQACEHDATNAVEIERLVLHELIHVLHSDHNRSPAFDQINNIDWFVEGLATYASGQLDEERLTSLEKHVRESAGPTRLAQFWTGPHRYGQAGSIVAYIDHSFGREVLSELMEYNDVNDMLKYLDLTEKELIDKWKKYLLQ